MSKIGKKTIGTPNVRYFATPISVTEAKRELAKRDQVDLIDAVRRATKVLKGHNEADIAWTQTRAMALMFEGVAFVDAVSLAAEECSGRIILRKLTDPVTLTGTAPEARGDRGQQPTLKTSLGDLLAARRGRR